MTEVPHVAYDEAHTLNDEERERLAYHLGDVARQVRTGVLGTIPAGMPSQTYQGMPVQGVVVEVVFTRTKG